MLALRTEQGLVTSIIRLGLLGIWYISSFQMKVYIPFYMKTPYPFTACQFAYHFLDLHLSSTGATKEMYDYLQFYNDLFRSTPLIFLKFSKSLR